MHQCALLSCLNLQCTRRASHMLAVLGSEINIASCRHLGKIPICSLLLHIQGSDFEALHIQPLVPVDSVPDAAGNLPASNVEEAVASPGICQPFAEAEGPGVAAASTQASSA